MNGERKFRARVDVATDGRITVTPYNEGMQGARVTVLKSTAHGELSETTASYRLLIRIPKRMGLLRASQLIFDEAAEASDHLADRSDMEYLYP